MSTCSGCGAHVFWARRADGSNHPPLEYLLPAGDRVYTVTDNVVREHTGAVFTRHRCDRAQSAAYQASEALREEKAREGREEYEQARTEAYSAALGHACPRCLAAAGEPCRSQAVNARQNGKPTRWPHEARREERPDYDSA